MKKPHKKIIYLCKSVNSKKLNLDARQVFPVPLPSSAFLLKNKPKADTVTLKSTRCKGFTTMSDTQSLPETIYFIELPKQIDLGQATLLPEIPIPVEIEQGESFDLSRLRPEMIVSAMLRVLSAQPDHEHADYYRQIVRILYPNVDNELSKEGIMRAREGDFSVAEHIFSALAGLEPDDARHALNLAVLYEDWAESSAKAGDSGQETLLYDKARVWYERLMSWEPPLADAFYNAAYFYAGQRNFERAVSLFT